MSNLVFVYDRQFQQHRTPEMHPESPDRLAAIEEKLHNTELIKQVKHAAPRVASGDELATVHNADYIADLEKRGDKAKSEKTILQLDPDTWMSPETYDIAKLAAGAGLVAVDAVVKGDAPRSFVAARPPGHHALSNRPMGFCLFNNVAVAARYAQQQLGLERILIIDWDVHHGNGTQDMFYDDPSVCFVSFHQYPFWPPDSGWYTEDGSGEGKGYNINIPLPAGTGDEGYLKAWDALVTPIAREYKPDLIILSAGYDAHQDDPLGQQRISTPGYHLLSNRLAGIAEENGSKLSCFLEGGYNTQSLSEAVVTTMMLLNAGGQDDRQAVKTLGGIYGGEVKPVTPDRNPQMVDERIASLKRHYGKYWQPLRSGGQ